MLPRLLTTSAVVVRKFTYLRKLPPTRGFCIPLVGLRGGPSLIDNMAKAKRKHSTLATTEPTSFAEAFPPPPKRRASQRAKAAAVPTMNPDLDSRILDGPEALRASPDASESEEQFDMEKVGVDTKKQVKEEDDSVPSLVTGGDSESSLSELSELEPPTKKPWRKTNEKKLAPTSKKAIEAPKAKEIQESQFLDPEADGEEEADEEEIQAALSRPPPVNSDYLPLPWKGRLGYVSALDFFADLMLTATGMSEYLSTLLEPSRLCLPNLSNCLYTRKSSSTQRSKSACTCYEE